METGFTVDTTLGSYLPTIWVEGEPERSFRTLIKIRDKTRRRVNSYRCADCGFLELYALEEWSLKFPK